ncbi:MAG: hypothetical protein OES24_00805 [Acidimicrobiia bacterium]|nr:hypothetical protein [Acidimicrobiia bacterium]
MAKQGTIPGAVDRDGEWLIPTMSLMTVAKQQGWTLDLAALQHQLDEHALSRYSGDALAAQAAVLLAKTQATAARVESRDLLRRLREATATAEADRAARAAAAESLGDLQRELEEARRNKAVAEARAVELTTRLSSEDQQFQFMVDRIKSLEQERDRLNQSLGWLGRLRYRRLVERDLSKPSTPTERSPAERSLSDRTSVEAPSRPTGGSNTVDATDERPTADRAHTPTRVPMIPPLVPIATASTVTDLADTVSHRPDVLDDAHDPDRPAPADRLRQRYTPVPRSPDGRFDRSGMTAARSASPLPTR